MQKTSLLGGALFGLCLLIFTPGFFTIPVTDRDEALFVQTSAQMLESNDFVDLRFDDRPRYKKPAGIYWLQSLSAKLTGMPQDVASYRLVSLVGAIGAVMMTFMIGTLFMSPSTAFAGAALMGASFILGAEARIAKTDAMQLFTILMAQYAVLYNHTQNSIKKYVPWGIFFMFWGGLAAATLIKGPIGFLVVLPVLIVSCRRKGAAKLLGQLRPGLGVLLFLGLVLPWYIAITIKSDWAFWRASLVGDMIGKLNENQQGHKTPFGAHAVFLWGAFWPGSMVFLAAIPAIWRARRHEFVIFAAAWFFPMWLVFELAPSKLLHYLMPTYPALAMISVWSLSSAAAQGFYPKRILWGSLALGGFPFITLAVFAYFQLTLHETIPLSFWAGLLILFLSVPMIYKMLRRQHWQALGVAAFIASFGLSVAIYPTLAQMDRMWPSVALEKIATQNPNCGLWVAGFDEPSLVFTTHRQAHIVETGADIVKAMTPDKCVIAAVTDAEMPRFLAGFPTPPSQLSQFDKFNLGNGQVITFHIFLFAPVTPP